MKGKGKVRGKGKGARKFLRRVPGLEKESEILGIWWDYD